MLCFLVKECPVGNYWQHIEFMFNRYQTIIAAGLALAIGTQNLKEIRRQIRAQRDQTLWDKELYQLNQYEKKSSYDRTMTLIAQLSRNYLLNIQTASRLADSQDGRLLDPHEKTNMLSLLPEKIPDAINDTIYYRDATRDDIYSIKEILSAFKPLQITSNDWRQKIFENRWITRADQQTLREQLHLLEGRISEYATKLVRF